RGVDGLEELDRAAARLDRLLVEAEPERDGRRRDPSPGGEEPVALLLRLSGHLLIVGEGLTAFAAIDRLHGLVEVDGVLAGPRRFLRGGPLAGLRHRPSATAAGLRLRHRGAGDQERRSGEHGDDESRWAGHTAIIDEPPAKRNPPVIPPVARVVAQFDWT